MASGEGIGKVHISVRDDGNFGYDSEVSYMGSGDLFPVRVINSSRDRLWCLVSNKNGWDAYPLEPGEASHLDLDIDGVGHYYYGDAPIQVPPQGKVNGDREWWRMSCVGWSADVEISGPSAENNFKKLRVVGGDVSFYRQDEDDPELANLTYRLAFPGNYPPQRI